MTYDFLIWILGLVYWLVCVLPSGVHSAPLTQRLQTLRTPGNRLKITPWGNNMVSVPWLKDSLVQRQLDLSVKQVRGTHKDMISNNVSSSTPWVTFSSNLVWSTHHNCFFLISNKEKWGIINRPFLWWTYVNWHGEEDSVYIWGGGVLL